MQRKQFLRWSLIVLVAALLVALFGHLSPTRAAPAADFEVIAEGLANPRGLAFGPGGALFVAEAGSGGDGACINGPEGRACYGETGAITRVTFDAGGNPTGQSRVISGLSSLALEGGGNAIGPHDVAFRAGGLYFLTGLGGDPALRAPDGPFGAGGQNFARIATGNPTTGQWSNWADPGQYEADHNPDGGRVDTNPFDLLNVGGTFVLADAGANALLRVGAGGGISTLAVFPDRMVEFPPGSGEMVPMQAVPTAVTIGPDGAYYVSQLTGFPFPLGGANIFRVEPGGQPEVYASGFTNILDIAFDTDGTLYVLEMFTHGLLSENPTGAITRVDPGGSRAVIAREGLTTPTGMIIGADHALYVSNKSTSATEGEIVRIPTRLSEARQFSAILTGAAEVPPVDTAASGVARFTLGDDGKLDFEVAVWNITAVTAAHIHLGPPGVNGGVIFPLYTGSGVFDPEHPISGELSPTPEQIEDLLAGNYYVNVHTTANPSGAIRGQIAPATTQAFRAPLAGANEVPPVNTRSTGTALMTLSPDMTALNFRLLVADTSDLIVAAHIHGAPPGSNGPVIFTLYNGSEPFDEGHPIGGALAPSLPQVAALLAGDYYVNAHTLTNPGGEIRGQLAAFAPPSAYHAPLTGAEEVAPVNTPSTGIGRFALSADLSMLDYHLAVADIADILAAHLHTGWPGQNGPVAHTLYDGSGPFGPNQPIDGLLTLDAQGVLDLISGYYYANVHTAANPGGQIRGQAGGPTVYGAALSGAAEVPPVDTTAGGRAVMALDAWATTLNYRVMVSDITGVTASHIHRGAPGVNGPVVFPLFTGGVFDEDNPVSGALALTDADVLDLLGGRFYVNVHTGAHPGGEIRGQLSRQRPPERFQATLDGAQEVPPVQTGAAGNARFTLDAGRSVLHFFVGVRNITGVTASHIHKGRAGESGPVVHPLYLGGGTFGPGSPIGGAVDLTGEHLVDLLTGYYYVNVHTTAHPGGEIRGQIGDAPNVLYYPILAAP